MKKTWQLFLTLAIVVVGSFLFKQTVWGADYLYQGTFDTTYAKLSGTSGLTQQQNFTINWTTSTQAVYSVDVILNYVYDSTIGLKLYARNNSGPGNQTCGYNGSSYILNSINTVEYNGGDGPHVYTFYFDIDYDCNYLSALSTLAVNIIEDDGPYTYGTAYGSSDVESFFSTSSFSSNYGGTPTSLNPINDLFLGITAVDIGETSWTTTTGETYVNFSPEFVSSTAYCDFDAWALEFYLNANDEAIFDEDSVGFSVLWGTDPDILIYNNSAVMGKDKFFPGYTGRRVWTYIDKPENFEAGTYYAKVCYCTSADSDDCYYNSNLYECSAVQEFQIDDTCINNEMYQGATSEDQAINQGFSSDICEGIEGTVTAGFCKVFQYLFMPSTDSISRFQNIQNLIETKPPFGYFSIYKQQFDTMSTSTSSTLESSLGTDYNNYSDIQEISIFDKIYTAITWLLWFLFGFWVINRFRHFSLHG